jgi:hypothetical protein
MCSRRYVIKGSEDGQEDGLVNANEVVDNVAGYKQELKVRCGQKTLH